MKTINYLFLENEFIFLLVINFSKHSKYQKKRHFSMKQRKPRIVFRISQSSIYKQIAYNDYIGRNAADVEVIIYNMDAQNQKSVLSIYKS